MKIILTTFLLTVLLLIGCAQNPTVPTHNPQPEHLLAFWDDPQPEGWIGNGTYMTRDELVIYFAAHYTKALMPPDAPEVCAIYQWWHKLFNAYGPRPWLMVRWYERYRCDIPYYLDIEPPC